MKITCNYIAKFNNCSECPAEQNKKGQPIHVECPLLEPLNEVLIKYTPSTVIKENSYNKLITVEPDDNITVFAPRVIALEKSISYTPHLFDKDNGYAEIIKTQI